MSFEDFCYTVTGVFELFFRLFFLYICVIHYVSDTFTETISRYTILFFHSEHEKIVLNN